MTMNKFKWLETAIAKELYRDKLYLAVDINEEEYDMIQSSGIECVEVSIDQLHLSCSVEAVKGSDLPVLISAGRAIVGIRDVDGMNKIVVTEPQHIDMLFDGDGVDFPFTKEQCMADAKLITEVVQFGTLQAGAPVPSESLDWVERMMRTRFRHFKVKTESRLQDQLIAAREKPHEVNVNFVEFQMDMVSKCREICKGISIERAAALIFNASLNHIHVEVLGDVRIAIQHNIIRFDKLDDNGDVLSSEYYTNFTSNRSGRWLATQSGNLLARITDDNKFVLPIICMPIDFIRDYIIFLSGFLTGIESITNKVMNAMRKGKYYNIFVLRGYTLEIDVTDGILHLTLIDSEGYKVDGYYAPAINGTHEFWREVDIIK